MYTLHTTYIHTHYTTQAGQAPQRVRTTLVCTPRSADGRSTPFTPLFISARCEVQEPWVRLSTSALDFGGAYTGIALQRHITVTNLSNLETRFRWERPGGRAHTEYSATVEPAAGALLGKQSLRVTITYTALTSSTATTTGTAGAASAGAGAALLQLEDVLACKVFGVAAPLGLVLRARHYGLTLSYDALPLPCDGQQQQQLPPAPLQPPHKTQWELSSHPPVPGPPVNFNFGIVPLLRRRTVQFCIRNLSAIAAPFALSARKYANGTRAPASLVDTPMSQEAFRKVLASPAALARHLGGSSSCSSVLMTASSSRQQLLQQQKKGSASKAHGSGSSVTLHNTLGSYAGNNSSSSSVKRAGNGSTVYISSGSSSGSSGAPLLSGTREAVEAFASTAGRERLAVQRAEREDMYALRHGRGIALLIEPACGTVPPWGVCTVTVTLHNDMPGRYFDDILCTTGPAAAVLVTAMARSSSSAANVHTHSSTDIISSSNSGSNSTVVKLPVRCEVSGCPLSLKPESLGLNCTTVPHPVLSFAQVLAGGSGASRSLRVLNTGTCTAELTWRMCEADDSSTASSCGSSSGSSSSSGKPLVDVQIGISETGAVSVAISYSEKKPFASPFVVEPAVGRVPPRGEVSTNMKLARLYITTLCACCCMNMTALHCCYRVVALNKFHELLLAITTAYALHGMQLGLSVQCCCYSLPSCR
jgi:hypothetical protein